MHDPDAVAFNLVRPWPRRAIASHADAGVRWQMRYRHRCTDPSTCDGCHGRTNAEMFPWWKPSSYSRFWTIAGIRLYWPDLITVWHHDPGGYDHGDVCKRGSHWKLHLHHMHVQVHPLQELRRRLLTRCAWCGGRSTKNAPVNVSHEWDGERGPWWKGEPGLFHSDCSSAHNAHRTCLCDDPLLEHHGWGLCFACGKFRPYGRTTPEQLAPHRLLVDRVPQGHKPDPDTMTEARAMWADLRAADPEARDA
jgi:hypothetical protein